MPKPTKQVTRQPVRVKFGSDPAKSAKMAILWDRKNSQSCLARKLFISDRLNVINRTKTLTVD